MPTIAEAFATAFQHHQAGELHAAEQIYRQILAVAPDHADVLHLLGLIDFRRGNHESAVEHIQRAIELHGSEAGYHGNLGNVFKAQGDRDRAIASYRRALELNANYAVAHYNLGTVYQDQNQFEDAVESLLHASKLRPDHVETYISLGNALQALGKLDEAIPSFRGALEINPNNAVAYYNLANALQKHGKLQEAIESYGRALEIEPNHAATHFNLANAWQAQGRLNEAIVSYRSALALQPDYPEANNNLGNAYLALGDLDNATACFRLALKGNPDFPEACNNLGNALQAQGNLAEAADCFRRALLLMPNYPVALYNLGNAIQTLGKSDEAIECYRRALTIQPNDPVALNNLSTALQANRQLDEAATCCLRAIELNPNYAEAYSNLGNIYRDQGKHDSAYACFQRAIELKPEYAEAYLNLGHLLQVQGKFDEAINCFRQALELKPNFAEAFNNLGAASNDQGKLDEAIGFFRRALEIQPDYAECANNLLLSLQYCDGSSLGELAAAHAEYERLQAAPLRSSWQPHQNEPSSERPLRLGFVSADFGRHPVGFFLMPPLENLDRKACQIFCYHNRLVNDERTDRLQSAATVWREVHGMRDANLAEVIREDRIDILFDLAGHTAKNRLLVFARKPAPIQVTWAGYVGTTGLKAMDYILADRYEIPPEAEVYYSERVLRMPDGYVCYDPPAYAPTVAPLPARTNGFITFASFNNPPKITPQVLDAWATILHRVPQSRLIFKYRGMDDVSTVNRIMNAFQARGIDAGGVECLGRSPHETLLAEYNRVDLALDPFPYNGGLTTCEALWMGVPVITCPGQTFASRHSLSHLSVVGLTETIARDREEYVELAVTLANDVTRLADLRANLRGRMAGSPLCDGKRFAENLMRVLREIWREWCARHQGTGDGGQSTGGKWRR